MGFKVNIEDKYLDAFQDSHPQCTLKKGDRIRKNRFDPGDMDTEGEEGEIVGVAWNPDATAYNEILLVKMDKNDVNTLSVTLPFKFDKL